MYQSGCSLGNKLTAELLFCVAFVRFHFSDSPKASVKHMDQGIFKSSGLFFIRSIGECGKGIAIWQVRLSAIRQCLILLLAYLLITTFFLGSLNSAIL